MKKFALISLFLVAISCFGCDIAEDIPKGWSGIDFVIFVVWIILIATIGYLAYKREMGIDYADLEPDIDIDRELSEWRKQIRGKAESEAEQKEENDK